MFQLKGRTDDFIVNPSGKKISSLALARALYDCETNGVKEFRIIQKTKRLIEAWIVPKDLTDKDMESFVSSLNKVVGEDIGVQVHLVNEIPKDRTGKLRRIISKIH